MLNETIKHVLQHIIIFHYFRYLLFFLLFFYNFYPLAELIFNFKIKNRNKKIKNNNKKSCTYR